MEQAPQNMTPERIDTELARLWTMQETARNAIRREQRFLAAPQAWVTIRQLEAHADTQTNMQIALDAATAEAAPYETEFRARPWNRYFLVTNGNGHVHRGMDCTTCYPTTSYAWLPELSGCDEAAMIEEFGEKACTVCFPTAPANPSYHKPGRRDQAARDAKTAEKAARDEAKASKAITAPDGTPLRVGGDRIATKVAAQRALSSAVQNYGWYGPTHPQDFAGQVAALRAALSAAGIDPEPIISRAAKKVQKEGGEHTLPSPASAQ